MSTPATSSAVRRPAYRLVRRPVVTAPPLRDDPLQQDVTDHVDGPLLVVGGPGTGKTTVLVESVAARIAAGVDPEHILVLTFGRRGSAALRDRIEARIAGTPVHEPLVRTFHAYAFGLLRRAAAAIVQLSDKVRWTLRFTGSTAEQSVDLRTGTLAGLELAGGTGRATLRLPDPKGTVALKVTGDIGSLDVLTRTGVPVRLKLGLGADSAVVDTRTRTKLTATTITPPGWSTTANRYDLTAKTRITAVRVTRD